MVFDEKVLIWALTSRPEDARRFVNIFRPEWLGDIELRPILNEIYTFMPKFKEPPSLPTLHKYLKDKDNDLYELRYKDILNDVQLTEPDTSEALLVLGKAKDVAITRSFMDLVRNPAFESRQVEYDGDTILKEIHAWYSKFSGASGDRTMDLKSAIENLIKQSGPDNAAINERIPVGVGPMDEWAGGGLRRKQLGVIISPTGGGKTTALAIMTHKIATIERKRVWFVTNELSIEEVTERLMTRLSGIELHRIIDDPILGFKGLKRHWIDGLQDRLWMSEVNREVTTDDLEAEMASWANLKGWKPDVLVLDYMERMAPCGTGYRRDKEWQWLGAIANDLVRMAKRHNIVIWSAAQTNRSGLNVTGGITGEMSQGSIRHLQECTSVVGLNQVEIPGKGRYAMQFSSIKQRQSKKAIRTIAYECDLGKMNITNIEVDMQLFAQQEEDARMADQLQASDTEMKGRSPLQEQKRKKKWQSSGSHS